MLFRCSTFPLVHWFPVDLAFRLRYVSALLASYSRDPNWIFFENARDFPYFHCGGRIRRASVLVQAAMRQISCELCSYLPLGGHEKEIRRLQSSVDVHPAPRQRRLIGRHLVARRTNVTRVLWRACATDWESKSERLLLLTAAAPAGLFGQRVNFQVINHSAGSAQLLDSILVEKQERERERSGRSEYISSTFT